MPSADEIRDGQRESWNAFAPGWEKWDSVVVEMLAPVGEAMIRSLEVAEDQQHLDVAAGTGEPGLTIAARAPRGRVMLTDLSPDMLDVARRRAAAKGIENIEVRECSADDLPFADASFDSASVRFGFMFFPNLQQTAAELARVLKPGGRVCASVWAAPGDNPWVTIPIAAIAEEVAVPPPDPDAPGMFRCAAPGAIAALFEGAGLRDVREWDVATVQSTASPEEYWQLLNDLAAPVVAMLTQADDTARERIKAKTIEAARAFETDGRIRAPGMARCVVGTK